MSLQIPRKRLDALLSSPKTRRDIEQNSTSMTAKSVAIGQHHRANDDFSKWHRNVCLPMSNFNFCLHNYRSIVCTKFGAGREWCTYNKMQCQKGPRWVYLLLFRVFFVVGWVFIASPFYFKHHHHHHLRQPSSNSFFDCVWAQWHQAELCAYRECLHRFERRGTARYTKESDNSRRVLCHLCDVQSDLGQIKKENRTSWWRLTFITTLC